MKTQTEREIEQIKVEVCSKTPLDDGRIKIRLILKERVTAIARETIFNGIPAEVTISLTELTEVDKLVELFTIQAKEQTQKVCAKRIQAERAILTDNLLRMYQEGKLMLRGTNGQIEKLAL